MKIEKVKHQKDDFLTDLLSRLLNDSVPDQIEVAPLKAIVLVKFSENQAWDKKKLKTSMKCLLKEGGDHLDILIYIL